MFAIEVSVPDQDRVIRLHANYLHGAITLARAIWNFASNAQKPVIWSPDGKRIDY